MYEATRIIIAVVAFLIAAPALHAAELTVKFTGLEGNSGNLMIGLYSTPTGFDRAIDLYSDPDGFLRDKGRVIGAAIRLDTQIRTMTFGGLSPGRYGIIVFHDQDVDGMIDKSLGIFPTEAYGFSNNVFGPLCMQPDFDDAAIPLDAEDIEVVIKVSRRC